MTFQAKRITREYTQQFQATPEVVFPLLCPTREYEWIEPWKCDLLYSASGYAEAGCVFRTRFAGDASDEVWVISGYEPSSRIEFVRVNVQRVIAYSISLRPNPDATTTARNVQVVTALNPEGNQALETSTEESFRFEMRMGEAMLNHYLTTGKRLPLAEAIARAGQSR